MNRQSHRFSQWLKILVFSFLPLIDLNICSSQTNSLTAFLDSAKMKNPDLIISSNMIRYKTFEIDQIKAENKSPKMYLSADYLFAPYFNNNGQIVTTNPSPKAIGYDIGITNGGLFSALYNVDYPVFNRKRTEILVSEKENEIEQLNLQIEIINNELDHTVTNLFFESKRSLTTYQYAVQNFEFLKKQLEIVRKLTESGIFKYVDYKLMEIELHTNILQLEKLKSDYRTSLNTLRNNCGISDSSWVELENNDLTMAENALSNSVFLKSYQNDSITAIIQQNVFNSQYKPQFHAFANTGLNAVTTNDIQRRFGLSAGFQLTYTIYDGNQRSIKRQEQQVLVDQSSELRFLKTKELIGRKLTLKNNIESARSNLINEKEIISEYENLLSICQNELLQAQISVIDFLNINRNYFDKKLNYALHQIELNELINDYNYWEH
jgi:outer membrane protein TolC